MIHSRAGVSFQSYKETRCIAPDTVLMHKERSCMGHACLPEVTVSVMQGCVRYILALQKGLKAQNCFKQYSRNYSSNTKQIYLLKIPNTVEAPDFSPERMQSHWNSQRYPLLKAIYWTFLILQSNCTLYSLLQMQSYTTNN